MERRPGREMIHEPQSPSQRDRSHQRRDDDGYVWELLIVAKKRSTTKPKKTKRPSSPPKADSSRTPEWRTFERFVGRVERSLAPPGAVVRFDHMLPDKDDGAPRQIDASIECPVGTVEVLIVIEARRRGRRQGREWLEQLASKRTGVGATAIIAASSSGFARRLGKKARALGVELRDISSTRLDDLNPWVLELAGLKLSDPSLLLNLPPARRTLLCASHSEVSPFANPAQWVVQELPADADICFEPLRQLA